MALPANIVTRAITGAVFVGIIVGSILWHPTAVAALFGFFIIVGTWELYRIAQHCGYSPSYIPGITLGIILYLLGTAWLFYLRIPQNAIMCLLIIAPIGIATSMLYSKKKKPLENVAITVFGAIYVALPFLLLIDLGVEDNYGGVIYSQNLFLGFFILMWTSDTGAYLVGSTMGKTKLFERLSPKKTWEGTIGGGVFAIGMAFLLDHLFESEDLSRWIVMAIIIVVFGNLGDLFESMLKRSAGVKDSGKIMPGHGGILDRFDATLFAAPMVFVAFQIMDMM